MAMQFALQLVETLSWLTVCEVVWALILSLPFRSPPAPLTLSRETVDTPTVHKLAA